MPISNSHSNGAISPNIVDPRFPGVPKLYQPKLSPPHAPTRKRPRERSGPPSLEFRVAFKATCGRNVVGDSLSHAQLVRCAVKHFAFSLHLSVPSWAHNLTSSR